MVTPNFCTTIADSKPSLIETMLDFVYFLVGPINSTHTREAAFISFEPNYNFRE